MVRGVDVANVKMSMNPFDEIAVEEAVRLKEAGVASEVIAVSCGVAQAQETLRTALAIGADRAILIESSEELQPLAVAKLLKALVDKEQPSLVILGKQAIDDDSNQTGQMLAALAGSAASDLRIEGRGGRRQGNRFARSGWRWRNAVADAASRGHYRSASERAALRDAAEHHESEEKATGNVQARRLGVDVTPRLKTLKVVEPPKRAAGAKVPDVKTLVEKLKTEAKVL